MKYISFRETTIMVFVYFCLQPRNVRQVWFIQTVHLHARELVKLYTALCLTHVWTNVCQAASVHKVNFIKMENVWNPLNVSVNTIITNTITPMLFRLNATNGKMIHYF